MLSFFEEHDVKLLRVLTDRGSEFCGNPERHEYELYLAVEDIDHSRTKTKSPQINGICFSIGPVGTPDGGRTRMFCERIVDVFTNSSRP